MRLSERFDEAMAYAAELHREQLRKGADVPYLSHVLAVASLVLEAGGDEDTAIAALLHDAFEDQGGQPTLEAIRRRFGERVAGLVEACSDSQVQPKPPWQERKERYLTHLAGACREARLISTADKVHNLRAILRDRELHGEAVWERFKGGRDGTRWYYRQLVEELGSAENGRLGAELKALGTQLQLPAAAVTPATA